MEIKKIKLTDLKPLERNVRRHGEKQIEHFVESLRQFGQTRAFVIDEDKNILVGNGMYSAMTAMGGWDKVDCHIVRGLSEIEKKKLVLSDNKVFQLGADDYDAIESMLKEFAEAGDCNVAGYDEDVIKALARSTEEVLDSMNEYGVLDDEDFQQNDDGHELGSNGSRIDDSVEMDSESYGDETREIGPKEAQETASTIICPHCGGVVVLDA